MLFMLRLKQKAKFKTYSEKYADKSFHLFKKKNTLKLETEHLFF